MSLDTLQDNRSEGYYGELWKEVEEIAEHCKISVQTLCKIQPKTRLKFHDSLMMSTVGQKNSDQSDGESFRIAIFYLVLDSLTAELQNCFSKQNCEIMQRGPVSQPKEYNILE